MKHIGNAVVITCFSLIFLVVFLPLGALMRRLLDPMRLRKSEDGSYLRMVERPTRAQSIPPIASDANTGYVRKF